MHTPSAINIILIGPMGAGKTSIGRQLARRLQRPFLDSDKVLEERTGVDIRTIFHYEGEQGFRIRESAIIDELTRKQGIVLATGGGAVLGEQNRQWLSTRGTVVYLRVNIEIQLARTAQDHKRPLLQTKDRRSKLEALEEQRSPLYQEIADIVLDTDKHSISVIVNSLIRQLGLAPR